MDIDNTQTSVRLKAGGRIRLREHSDDLPQRWWFASTGIPLIVASLGPLSHVLSLASWVSTWRMTLPDNGAGPDNLGVGIPDPQLELNLNAVSLAFGFTGNFFLLLHFKSRVRYIIALPIFVTCWLLSSFILIATIIGMCSYAAPIPPVQTWSQGFWHAVFASVIYFFGSVGLLINMAGYLRGHYPQQFALDEDQRTLIQQSMMFFFWLAGCAAVFSKLEGLTYPDALYYADVSILTIGFGDIAPKTEAGRGFLFVFQLVGIIFLGLVISSISRFAANISADKIFKRHQKHTRASTFSRTVTNESELRERLGLPPRSDTNPSGSTPVPENADDTDGSQKFENYGRRGSLVQYGQIKIVGHTVTFHEDKEMRKQRRKKLLLLQEDKDRFDAMRQIQLEAKRWKQYWALAMSFLAFGILWCLGAFIFMTTEKRILNLGYFDCLYFCFVALLTIGYGDIAPKSNIGKPFFILWSLVAVPIVTFLITEMSKTVIAAVSRGTAKVTDWTVILDKYQAIRNKLSEISHRRQERKRIARGFQVQDPDEIPPHPDHVDDIELGTTARPKSSRNNTVSRSTTYTTEQPQESSSNGGGQDQDPANNNISDQLAQSIKSVARDLRVQLQSSKPRQYTYEEWAHFTKLIKATNNNNQHGEWDWDWIGEDSPMLADITEAEWVLDRLCESLGRYTSIGGGSSSSSRPEEGGSRGLGEQ